MAARSKRPLWRRALRLAGTLLGGTVALAVALLVAVDPLSNLPFARRLAVREINHVLAPLFKGRIILENIESLHIRGVGGVDVRIQAPDGTTVIMAHGVRGRIAPLALVASLLRHGELRLDFLDCDADSVDVNLDTDESGALKLATAFELAQPSSPPSPGETPGRPLHLEFPHLATQHAHAHGQILGAPLVDTDVDGLLGSVAVLPDRVTVDVDHAELTARGMPQGANPRGTIKGHLAVPFRAGADVEADASFAGDVGGIPATAKAALRGDRLDAVVDVPEVAADKIRALVAQAPIDQSAAVHAEAHGPFASLDVTGHATAGAAQVDAHGTLALAGKFAGTIALDLRRGDLRAFAPTAPHSTLGLHADVHAGTNADGLLSGGFSLVVPDGGEVAGQSIPAASFRGDFDQRPRGAGFSVNAAGTVSEPGAPIAVRLQIHSGLAAPVVDFVASSQIDRLGDVRRAGSLGPGSAHVRVAGVVTLSAEPSFDAAFDADVVGFAHGSVHVDRAKLAARGFGPLSSPTMKGTLDVSRAATDVHASVDRVHEEAGRLDATGISITGLGEPLHAALHLRPEEISVQGESKGLDLKTVGYLLGIEDKLREGRLIFAVDFSARRNGARGTAMVDLANVCLGDVDGLSAHIGASMVGRKLTGSMNAAATGVATLNVKEFDLQVGGRGPLDAASWRRMGGSIELEGQADMAKVAGLLPPNTLPFAQVSGQIALEGHVKRDAESDVTPDVRLTLRTSGLVLSPQSAPDDKGDLTLTHPEAWQMAGIDAEIDATASGATGATAVDVRLVDKHGPLASLVAKSGAIPYGLLLASGDRVGARLMNVPVSAVVTVPPRKLAALPDILQLGGASGEVEGSIAMEGTFLKAKVDAHVTARSVKFDSSPLLTPLDADAIAKYDGAVAEVTLDMRSATEKLLHATARVDAKMADFVAGTSNAPPWNASAQATLSHFPLESIASLADRHLHGSVSGRVEMNDWHRDARMKADFDIDGLRVGKVQYSRGKVAIGFDGRTLDAKVRLDQEGGFASATAKIGMLWGANFAPSADASASMELSLQAKHFSAAFLEPFVQSTVDEVGGTIDADAQISSSAGKKPEMKGSAELSDGLVEVVALGQEFRAVKAKVTLTPDGVLRLESMSAQGTGGKVTGSGTAHLDGTALVSAEVNVKIAKSDAMPLDLQGANLGTMYGQFGLKATASADRKTMNLDLDVPSLHVLLPEASTHLVQDLDVEPSQDHVGVYALPGRFVVLPIDGAPAASKGATPSPAGKSLTVVVHLGQDVDIRRGTDFKVTLGGTVTAKVEQQVHLTGQIRLLGGKLDVQGKSFEIETGTVTFVGDPSNPMIKVTAGWTAEDGTRVFADYVGPLKTGRVALRSEPARPKNEIVALILFGTADGSQATPYATPQPDVATRAGTTAGGFATAGLSKGLDKLTGMDITAKIDTSQQNPRPEVEVQVAKDISLQLAFVLGQPPLGTNPDTTYATLDWRFIRNWSLETTFGNLGSSIADVVWRHRY